VDGADYKITNKLFRSTTQHHHQNAKIPITSSKSWANSVTFTLFFFLLVAESIRGGSIRSACNRKEKEKKQADLETRLQQYFSKYAMARRTLYGHLARNDTFLSKHEWDLMLEPDLGHEISNDQLTLVQQLECFHGDIISQAEVKARQTSKSLPNLDEIRLDRDKVQSFCNEFPRSAVLNVGLLVQGIDDKETINHLLEYFDPPIDTDSTMEILAGNSSILVLNNLFENFSPLGANRTYQSLERMEKELIVDVIFSLSLTPTRRNQVLKTILGQSKTYNEVDRQEIVYKNFYHKCKRTGISYIEFVEPALRKSNPQTASIAQKKMHEYSEKLSSLYSINDTSEIQAIVGMFLSDFVLEDDAEYGGLFQTDILLSGADNLVGIDIIIPPENNNDHTDNCTFDTLQKVAFSIIREGRAYHSDVYPLQNVGVQLGDIRDSVVMGVKRIGIRSTDVLREFGIILEYARRENVSFVILENVIGNDYCINNSTFLRGGEDLGSRHRDEEVDHVYGQHLNTYQSFLRLARLGIVTILASNYEDANFTHDCIALVSNTNIQYTELKDLSYNAIRGSFTCSTSSASFLREEQLKAELDKKFQYFESSHGHHQSLSSWEVIGIVMGCVFGIILFVLILIQITCGIGTTLMFRRRPPIMYVGRRHKEEHSQSNIQRCP
jgi:hypothetical protein